MKEKHVIGYEVHTLDIMMGKMVSSVTEKDGITKMQGWVIRYLYEHAEEDVFQKDLEAYFHIARSTATAILQLMEKRGFLLREPVSSDARLKRLVLTPKAIQHQITVMENLHRLENSLRKDIPPEKLNTFFEVILMIKQNIEDNC